MKEYPIGAKIIKDGLIYEVRKGITCAGCSQWESWAHCCLNSAGELGECSDFLRSDGQDVIFVQVGEVRRVIETVN